MSEEDNKRAYKALLTLLDDGSVARKKRKAAPQATEPHPSKETSTDAVEGYGSEDDEEEDDEIVVEDDNEGDRRDPFEYHFAHPKPFSAPNAWKTQKVTTLPLLGERSVFVRPDSDETLLSDPKSFNVPFSSSKQALRYVKHRLHASFARTNGPELSPLQLQYASPLFAYEDILLGDRNAQNASHLLNLVVLHALNHIYKTRDRVIKHSGNKAAANGEDLDEFRDSGFTRARVLVLLPTRHAAYTFMNTLGEISGVNQIENQKRFKRAFYAPSQDFSTKPEDFQRLFAGNTNEVFCLGAKFTKQALKLYSSFYTSDIIVASPLGLRLIVDKGDTDFLSSVELCVVDQADAIAMQAWTNVKHIFENMNKIPKDPHDCDFSRVRDWYLDEKSSLLRQTVILSEYPTPEMVALFNKNCQNIGGKLRLRPVYAGIISSLKIHVRQLFTRLQSQSITQDSQNRLNHFTTMLLPSILRGAQQSGTLIVAPTYTDFVVLRNYLERHDHSYVSLSEYTPASQLGRGRSFFADARANIMLYSARLHHYRRYAIKGVRTIIFYGLPDNAIFYQELVRGLARTVIEQQIDPDLLKVHVLFSKYDALKLERIVGTSRMGPMMEGIADTHEIY